MENERPRFLRKLFSSDGQKLNQRVGVYLVCVLLASGMWMLITLSEKYETDINFKVTYSGIPKSKVVTNQLPETITAKVNAVGFSLFWYKLTGAEDELSLEIAPSKLRKTSDSHYLVTNSRLEKISSQLGNKIKILRIAPDTIYISFSEKLNRKLPVKTDLILSMEKQHGLYDIVKSQPEFVNVSGPKEIVERMDFAETERIVVKDANEKETLNVGFKRPENSLAVTFSPEKISLTIPVEKFTEGSLEIPVTVTNLPKGSKLKVFPEKVKVTYLVVLSKFDKVQPSMFTVAINYKKLVKGKSNKIKAELIDAPDFVNSVKIEPSSVEYIIQKK